MLSNINYNNNNRLKSAIWNLGKNASWKVVLSFERAFTRYFCCFHVMVEKPNLGLDWQDSTLLINQLTSNDQSRIWMSPDHWIRTLPSSSFSGQIQDTWTPLLNTNQESEPALPNACGFPAKSLHTASPENVNIINFGPNSFILFFCFLSHFQ